MMPVCRLRWRGIFEGISQDWGRIWDFSNNLRASLFNNTSKMNQFQPDPSRWTVPLSSAYSHDCHLFLPPYLKVVSHCLLSTFLIATYFSLLKSLSDELPKCWSTSSKLFTISFLFYRVCEMREEVCFRKCFMCSALLTSLYPPLLLCWRNLKQ
jgi:hypothetical protein